MNPLIFVNWWLPLRHRHNFEIDPSASSIVDVSPPCWLRQTQRLWRPTFWSYPQQNRRTRRGARNPHESVENVGFCDFYMQNTVHSTCIFFKVTAASSHTDHWLLYEYWKTSLVLCAVVFLLETKLQHYSCTEKNTSATNKGLNANMINGDCG